MASYPLACLALVESGPDNFLPVWSEHIAGRSNGSMPAHYPAYNLQEMLSLLPPTVNVPLKSGSRSKFDHMLFYGLLPGKCKHFVKYTTANKAEFRTVDQSLSGACFKMLLYLIENKLYTL